MPARHDPAVAASYGVAGSASAIAGRQDRGSEYCRFSKLPYLMPIVKGKLLMPRPIRHLYDRSIFATAPQRAHAAAHHGAVEHAECSVQGGGAVLVVVMCHRLAAPGLDRQPH
jgi:hypothetical protein